MRARAGSLALVACALSGAWAAPARGPVLDTAAYARRQAGQLPRTSAAAPPAEQWADRLVAPLWLYAQDLAEGDELEAVESIDVDGAASVLYKVSVENRFADGAFIVHHLGNGSAKLSYDAVLPLEAQDWEALALAAERQAGLLRMGLKSSAAGRLVDVAGVLRAAWLHEVAAGRAPEAAWDELLADWSYFGFKQDGVETGPSIGARARAQSLRYLRRQASQLEPAGAAPAESRAAARALWLAAQKTCADTQFLLTGEQIDAAARAAYPGLVGVRAQSRVNTSRARWAWELLESMTREEVRPRRRSGEGLWAALDPYAAMNLADILEKLARTPRAARLQTPKPGAAARPLFEDVTERSGLGVRSADALDKVSVGAAFLDYDQDGRPDVFVRMGRKGGRLFRTLGGFRFKDVPDAAGLSLSGARAFAADYDNDGYPDLFVLGAYGGVNRLFHNERNRTFKDVTAKAGLVQSPELAVSAVWLDFDDDGLLDLYVVHAGRYVDGVTPSGPTSDNGLPNRLYRNKGDGTFEDVTAKAGVGDPHWGWAAA
ncbi:MAG TPA: VCBS repeat-containing protein, partial [Elusimicrobiota bacterium]|nr:VCBS repeat-containing protein [Elusimicrobiota bacterium]